MHNLEPGETFDKNNSDHYRGETAFAWGPRDFLTNGHVLQALDEEARQSHYGYKNHVTIESAQLIRRYRVTDAAMHDSQVIEELLSETRQAVSYIGQRLPVQSQKRR